MVFIAAIINISRGFRKVSWISKDVYYEHNVSPSEIVKDVPDEVALKKILNFSQTWSPADEYTKNLVNITSEMKGLYEPGRLEQVDDYGE